MPAANGFVAETGTVEKAGDRKGIELRDNDAVVVRQPLPGAHAPSFHPACPCRMLSACLLELWPLHGDR